MPSERHDAPLRFDCALACSSPTAIAPGLFLGLRKGLLSLFQRNVGLGGGIDGRAIAGPVTVVPGKGPGVIYLHDD